MRTGAMALMIERAAASESKIGAAVRASTEVGVVVPSILRAKLEEAGCTIESEVSEAGRVRVAVWCEGALLAKGLSESAADALLQACSAALFEETCNPRIGRIN